MNDDDRYDLVNQMVDADSRAHPVDLPVFKDVTTRTPLDVLENKASAEFRRCGGREANWTEKAAPVSSLEEILARRQERTSHEHRSEVAVRNNVFLLRLVQICRSWGGCGPQIPKIINRPSSATLAWDAKVNSESYIPSSIENAEPFILSLACGMGLREKEGLPSYPNEAFFVHEEKAFQAERTRRCAKGELTACQ